ncbi:MAG: Sua5 YciO YrdC YwlC family protein, partial [Campylobacter sp.]|nr:Sua5 YciO YrdC YwlC family protein [Campylobacter sp.]
MIYLVQSDTTAGLLSQDEARLNALKGRAKDKPCVITVASLCVLKGFARVPKAHRALVRRSKKTSFIYPNGLCLRCVKDARHAKFLASFEGGWAYSTSANEHGKDFDINWAKSVA